MRKKIFVFAVGFLICVLTCSDVSARRLTYSQNTDISVVAPGTNQSTSNIEAIALSFLLLAISISVLQRFLSRKKSPVSAHYIVDQVEKLQSGVLRRVVGAPAK